MRYERSRQGVYELCIPYSYLMNASAHHVLNAEGVNSIHCRRDTLIQSMV